jgi:DNA-binding MarR family transcriptional regulator
MGDSFFERDAFRIGNILPMSTRQPESRVPAALAGLSEVQAAALGPRKAAQVRSFRLIVFVAQQLRYLTDQLYRADGLTTQQATLLTVVRSMGKPSLSEVAGVMFTSHQNAKQLVTALVNKGLLRYVADTDDARVRRLLTTAKNERHWAKRNSDDFEHVGEWLDALSSEEATQLYALLLKLQQSLSNRYDVRRSK